jgi:molybdopterin-guanine dinucleotide biosynthesis protein
MTKEMKMGTFIYNDETYNFEFATSLFANEKRLFVRSVISNIIEDKIYDVVLKDLIFDFVIIETFTNIDTSFVNMKDDNDEDIDPIILVEHFLENTNVVETVKENMEDGLLDELIRAVDLNIQYLTGIRPFVKK